MSEQEFLELVSLHVETYYRHEGRGRWDETIEGCGYKKRSGKKLNEINLDDIIYVKWFSGGVGGGSCWDNGTDHHYPVHGEQEVELTELDTLLDQVCPDITLKQYRLLMNGASPALVEYGEWEQNEYYGNYSCYKYKKVSLRRLFERLQGLGLI